MRRGALLLFVGLAWGASALRATPPQDATREAAGDSLQETAGDASQELEEVRAVLDELMALKDSVQATLVAQDTALGPERQVRRLRLRGWIARSSELQTELIDILPPLSAGMDPAPGDTGSGAAESRGVSPELQSELSSIRSDLEDYTLWFHAAYRDRRGQYQSALDSVAALRAEASPEEVSAIEGEQRLRRAQLDTLFLSEAQLLDNSEALGVDVEEAWRELEQAGVARADGLTGRLQLALLDRDRLRDELADAERARLSEAETSKIRNELQATTRRIDDLSGALGSTSDLLDARGLPTAGYRRLIIETTGVTGDILDREVLTGLLSDAARDTGDWIRTRGPTILVRTAILLLFVALGRYGARLVWWVLARVRRVRLPRLAVELVGRMVGPLGTVVGLGVGLSIIGVDTTTVLAGAGVAGVVLGLALQDSIANFASGFLILLYRPFDQDDTIEAAGVVGRVRSMGLANTTLITFDNRRVSIPNSKLWGEVIANRSSEPTRRAEAVVRVGFEQNLGEVSEVVLGLLQEHQMVLEEPAPTVHVSGAGDSWMEVTVWAWTRNADWWSVTAALPEMLKSALGEAGIPVPLPTRRVVGLEEQSHEPEVLGTRGSS